MYLAIEFCWHAGMIETTCKVVDDTDSIYCALYLRSVCDISGEDCHGFAKLLAGFLLVAYKHAHGLITLYKFCYQGCA